MLDTQMDLELMLTLRASPGFALSYVGTQNESQMTSKTPQSKPLRGAEWRPKHGKLASWSYKEGVRARKMPQRASKARRGTPELPLEKSFASRVDTLGHKMTPK